MRYSAAYSVFLLLSSLVVLSSTKRIRRDTQQSTNPRQNLINKLLKNYDKEKPSQEPLIVYTSMIIEHLRDFNEYDLTLHMQAMFIMSWRDTRLIWEPRDFGNITKITFDDYQVKRFWLPKVTAKAIMPMLGSIIQPMNTELLISSEGYVYSISQISTPTLCENQMELYPYDTPHCSLYIVNSNMEDLLIFGNRHMFGLRDSFVNGNNVTQTKGYDILNFTLQRYYITTDGMKPQTTEDLTYTPTKNGEKLESVITMGSVIHYQFFFHRNVDLYVPYILLPIYVGTLLVLLAGAIDDLQKSLIVLVFAIFFQFNTLFRVSLSLPPNYLRTPFCMKYGIAIFVETIVLLIYKIAYTSLLQNLANEKEVIANLCTINRYFKYFVLIQAIFCTWLLFF
ncbi:Acetylcholine receptor-like protein cup-4 [Aphelenchoides besseyi]|nr:Acetylcholine receptor-like protein cup-4 [Aphelenchoides besseyi]